MIRYLKVVDTHKWLNEAWVNLYVCRIHRVALFYKVSNCLATETLGLLVEVVVVCYCSNRESREELWR